MLISKNQSLFKQIIGWASYLNCELNKNMLYYFHQRGEGVR